MGGSGIIRPDHSVASDRKDANGHGAIKKQLWKYIGKGAFAPDVPARDLSIEEQNALPKEVWKSAMLLYRLVEE